MLVAVFKQEVVYFDAVFRDVYSSRMYVQVVSFKMTWLGCMSTRVCNSLFELSWTERGDGINLAAIGKLGVISPVECAVQLVIFGTGEEGEVEHGSLFH